MVRLGPPEHIAFWADCLRPALVMFYPGRSQTPGEWNNTIPGMAVHVPLTQAGGLPSRLLGLLLLIQFDYIKGPYPVRYP